MPTLLSSRGVDTTGDFYTRIHGSVAGRTETEGELPPTHVEFRDWLDRTFPSNRQTCSVLDAGCGTHAHLARICDERGFGAVHAVDVNPEVEGTFQNDAVRFESASILELPFADGHFDLVVCAGVAHHTPDPDAALAELVRVTRPGGMIYLSLYTFRRSVFHIAIRALRGVSRLVPYRAAHRIGGSVPVVNNFLLDHMYVPILWIFRAEEVRRSLETLGCTIDEEFVSSFDVFARMPLGRVVSGDGLLRVFVCRKL